MSLTTNASSPNPLRPAKAWLQQFGLAILLLGLIFNTGCSTAVNPKAVGTDPSKIKPIVKPVVVAADPTWFACKADTDCTVKEGVCGVDQAVNKNFTTQFFSYRDEMERSVDCINQATETTRHTAQCIKQRCTLNPPDHQP